MSQEYAGKFTIVNGLPEKEVFFIKNRFTIGRDINNTFTISKSSVSRHHARIEWKEKEQGYYIFDEGSENGIIVNGRLILANEKLSDKDTIFISDVECLFELVPFSADLNFKEEQNEVPEEGIGNDLTGTHFMDIAELNPDYFEQLREEKPKAEWIWDEGPEDKPKSSPKDKD